MWLLPTIQRCCNTAHFPLAFLRLRLSTQVQTCCRPDGLRTVPLEAFYLAAAQQKKDFMLGYEQPGLSVSRVHCCPGMQCTENFTNSSQLSWQAFWISHQHSVLLSLIEVRCQFGDMKAILLKHQLSEVKIAQYWIKEKIDSAAISNGLTAVQTTFHQQKENKGILCSVTPLGSSCVFLPVWDSWK